MNLCIFNNTSWDFCIACLSPVFIHACLGLLQTQHAIRQSHVSFGDRHLVNSHHYLGYCCQHALVRAVTNAFLCEAHPPSLIISSRSSPDTTTTCMHHLIILTDLNSQYRKSSRLLVNHKWSEFENNSVLLRANLRITRNTFCFLWISWHYHVHYSNFPLCLIYFEFPGRLILKFLSTANSAIKQTKWGSKLLDMMTELLIQNESHCFKHFDDFIINKTWPTFCLGHECV